MGVNNVYILIDEHWGCYRDKYDQDNCFSDIKKHIPHAKEVGRWGSTICIDVGKSCIERWMARFDVAFVQRDVKRYCVEKMILEV